ncbi:MAG TPA: hypothetical protein PLL06_14655 [Acidobacteriota bacterium]|nr:hypothetical protein [Acidobacteriota bacterium]HNB71914.1 hypothetical protein [Acidobacteriota bacterium]HND20351.1 hypothetical protein [Acidobacteriota bacterium]
MKEHQIQKSGTRNPEPGTLFLLLLLVLTGTSTALAKEQLPFPLTARTIEEFVPTDWTVLEKAEGDLNGDNQPDVVLALAPDSTEDEEADRSRWLLIAFREGKIWRRSIVSDQAILCRNCGGVFGDPFAGVRIERGSVVVEHYGGSAWRWAITDRFRWQQGQWVRIGNTTASFHTFEPDDVEQLDVNLLTGFAEEQTNREKGSKTLSFFQIRAGKSTSSPNLDGIISASEWPGTSVILKSQADIVSGRSGWRGKDDLSARLGALVVGKILYLRAEITDDQVTAKESVHLISSNREVIKPTSSQTKLVPGGYVFEAAYPLSLLTSDSNPEITVPLELRVSIEVVDSDPDEKTATILSTSRGGQTYPAMIYVTEKPGPEILEELAK